MPQKKKSGKKKPVKESSSETNAEVNASVEEQDTSVEEDENSTPRPVEPEAKPTPDPNPVAKTSPESPQKSGVNPPVSPSGNKAMKVWDDVPVISTDKAKLVMTELRTRMRPPYNVNGDEAPTLSAVLVAGMRELAALEVDDLQDSNVNPSIKAREIVVEVMCQTDFKTQVAFRMKDLVTAVQATALTSALRRLSNLQKSAVSTHDPVSSTLASALIAGLLTWDRDL
ncbi:hypothetical protein GUITHDRAFT_146104 [Guillardia theta CCMP2712]|uniref:Uncharacterized protein n=1 Tax=Guillardia theta (strain CCMP2712) TaxID=905079 RepID=L1II94_GUITC|nr:hypothetical protein GUITHDRAFT_146104 [Guillardia theta CCMP2712]EKX35946.1 hypothetical protein GUITHDRAFT_146104 [Guillardia theta CCMP2712]|eukprot:XP_005822926.1 hypothetical protein GUITHDRAFT_146104 [Guillardia theta CCMP2712]